jgi:acetolactate synthase-1/2/3 large subunit
MTIQSAQVSAVKPPRPEIGHVPALLRTANVETTAEAYLELLADRGVRYLFANAGTDFAPLIEAYARRHELGLPAPKPVLVAHETVAVAMAHGHAMVSGRAQAVMVHVIVGLANALCGIMNAARGNAPMLMTSGRTPITESGMLGCRDRPIHWAQESFDQGAMVREFVKWDYELRNIQQLETIVDRALAIAHAEPQGPVYLSLPREVIGEGHASLKYSSPARVETPRAPTAAPESVARAAEILAAAKQPIVIVKSLGRDPEAVESLVGFAETLGAPVFEQFHTHMNFPQNHALHAGFDVSPELEKADAILVIESDVPWFPKQVSARVDAPVIQLGIDPLYSDYPLRGFAADVALAGRPKSSLEALTAAVAPLLDHAAVEERKKRLAEDHARRREREVDDARKLAGRKPIEMAWLSHCIGQLIDDNTILVNEYDFDPTQGSFCRPGSYFGMPPVSGLGWGMGAALGAKLAAPERTVICCVGDGAYLFSAPTAAHYASRMHGIPVLFVIFNNQAWNAVKRSVAGYAAKGRALRSARMPLTYLDTPPEYEMICQANSGHAERVEDPAELPGALRRALRVVQQERRQALLNVICRKP